MKWYPITFMLGVFLLLLLNISPAIASSEENQDVDITGYFEGLSTPVDNWFESSEGDGWRQQGSGDDIFEYDKKSVAKAFILSLAIPGLGEYYAGSRIKPFIFFGADVLLWTGHVVYHAKGEDGEEDYRAYADDHWFREPYNIWWNSLTTEQQESYSHRLPPTNDYEYYENIGKYDQFVRGWDDYVEGGPVLTPHREHYLNLRKDANDNFDKARAFMVVAMVNHIVSGFDAALTAKAYNSKSKSEFFSDMGFRMIPKVTDDEIYPQLTLIKRF
ncbi:MAG: hypothetical protein GF315_10780 [candidate division Zixibacteria bacterium]|nr:hypothetical protein [candidate division Zixibacteria bacterium]